MDGIWKEMADVYRKLGLTEEEIADRIICKTSKILQNEKNLNECDIK